MLLSGVRPGTRRLAASVHVTGVAAAGAVAACWWRRPVVLVTLLAVTVVAVDVCLVDLATRRIPNRRVAQVVGLVVAAMVAGWIGGSAPWPVLAGALVGGGPVLVSHLVSPAGMGFGDVKWALALGAVVGLVGWPLAVLVPFVGAVLAVAGAALTRQRMIAFAPALSVGALVAVTFGAFWMGGGR